MAGTQMSCLLEHRLVHLSTVIPVGFRLKMLEPLGPPIMTVRPDVVVST